jgi:hypothetical protein
MSTVIALEAWEVATGDEEEPLEEQRMVDQAEFQNSGTAKDWAWEKMQQGFFVRLFLYQRRDAKGAK